VTLSPGTRLGPYEIQAAIGAGGMGEVYKAYDTRLDRSVAIKILPPGVSANPDRRARFEREAKTIAALNHPHICTLHDVGEHDGTTFLVMEHLTGETLAQRLEKGPLPLEQALTVATEIADALAAAHRRGVIHRDLKPGNVMLTKTGAKLLDFGLAKLTDHGEQAAVALLSSAPTGGTPQTAEGTIVGTLHYMAPEQVEGKAADARTDLWAVGAILYEMVTGKRAFEGTSAASVIGHIMNSEPPALTTLQPLTPPAVDRFVRQCLAKTPDDRPDTAHDVADYLRWLQEAGGVTAPVGPRRRGRRWLRTALVVPATAVVGVVAGAGLMWVLRPSPPRVTLARPSLDVRPADELNAGGVLSDWLPTPGGSRTALTWTPDGQALVFVGRRSGVQQLYVRPLDAVEARPLPNTEDAQAPAVSPDGRWVAFWAGGVIKKVPLRGGPVVDLASGITSPPRGLVWDTHGGVFFSRDDAIWVIPAEEKPARVTTVGEGEVAHTLPWPLPDGRTILYTVRKRGRSWGDEQVVAQSVPSGDRKLLLTDATDARYVPATGNLVFMRRGALWAAPFDPGRLELRGQGVPILDGIAQALTSAHAGNLTGAGQFAVSPAGALAWIAGPVVPYREAQLATVDRRGQVTALPSPTRSYGKDQRISPEGGRLAVSVLSLTEWSLWVYDLTRATLTPVNRDGESGRPVWTPDGHCLVFSWLSGGRSSLAMQVVDHPAAPQVLATGGFSPSSWHPDGRTLAVVRGGDVLIATIEHEKATVRPLWQTPQTEQWPEFSPDGYWLAYGSDVSERSEVYLQPYPGPGEVKQASRDGGESPAWHPSGRELFYLSLADQAGKRRMMAVDVAPGPSPRIGPPRVLFEFENGNLLFASTPVRVYDVAPDGQRFYVVQTSTPPPPPLVTHINLIPNWFEELKTKVPPGR
jgi:serine/threonine-protein kinase